MTTLKTSVNGSSQNPQISLPSTETPIKENQSADANRKIETVSGRLVDPANPNPLDIDLHDIAWGLSRISRFAGHTVTPIPYNVAQHSVHVSNLAEIFFNLDDETFYLPEGIHQTIENCAENKKEVLIKALFHDAHETYTGDIPSPIKNVPMVRAVLDEVEMKLDEAIYSHFCLSPKTSDEAKLIKFCDKVAQSIEADRFMLSKGNHWNLPKFDISLYETIETPLSATTSYSRFIGRYTEILSF